MAKYSFRLPDIGEGIAEAEVVAWHVKVGDMVEEDQGIADVMTDKATVEMEAPVAGKIIELNGEPGQMIAIGSVLAVFETDDIEDEEEHPFKAEPPAPQPKEEAEETPAREPEPTPAPAPPSPPPAPEPSAKRVLASPAVRQRAKELSIALDAVRPATGDRIRHADLDAFLQYGGGGGRARGASRADEEIKVIGMRRRIADNMAASKRHIPHFTYVEEIDVTNLEAQRAAMNGSRGERPKLTMLPLMIAAICKALPDWPMINATFDDEAGVVTRSGAVHLGIATQTDKGLMVPVLRDAQALSVWEMASEIVRLAEAARSGKAKSEELSGSTLTITSLGPLGGIATTPVINRPEVAIIGPNRIVERPAIVDGELEVRKLMNLSISCDHRVVDGWDAASFVQALKRLIETPILIFLD
ncbi:MAG: 2-oxo acid dehydrogenase subunit E2 [Sphingomonadaceae bacterium]|nr:2-oxo acid dehydrogenase subunit E2 [Sphingomonadaceae bacterium]